MASALTHSKTTEILKQVKFSALIDELLKKNSVKTTKLSKAIGRNANYLYKHFAETDHPVSLLLLLSHHLQANLFEPFMNLLPEDIRITQKEKELKAQIEALQKQMEDLAKERDIYKGIVMR